MHALIQYSVSHDMIGQAAVFVFRFYREGKAVAVAVDDWVPLNDEQEIVMGVSMDSQQMFLSLVEKVSDC